MLTKGAREHGMAHKRPIDVSGNLATVPIPAWSNGGPASAPVGIACPPMAFGRRKDRVRKGGGRDPFGHLRDERAQAEDGEPWFLGPDDGPELEVEAGISSNLEEAGITPRRYEDDRDT